MSLFSGPSRSGLALAALRRFESTCERVRALHIAFGTWPRHALGFAFYFSVSDPYITLCPDQYPLCVLLCSFLSSFRYSESLSSMSPPTTRSHSSTTFPGSREQDGSTSPHGTLDPGLDQFSGSQPPLEASAPLPASTPQGQQQQQQQQPVFVDEHPSSQFPTSYSAYQSFPNLPQQFPPQHQHHPLSYAPQFYASQLSVHQPYHQQFVAQPFPSGQSQSAFLPRKHPTNQPTREYKVRKGSRKTAAICTIHAVNHRPRETAWLARSVTVGQEV